MYGQIVDYVVYAAAHRASGSPYMATAAEERGNPAYVHQILGAHADLKFLRSCLIEENGNFHAFRKAQLVNDAVHILAVNPVKLHLALADGAEDAPSVKKGDALQKSSAQNLVLDVCFSVKAVVYDGSEVNSLSHQLTRYLHGVG